MDYQYRPWIAVGLLAAACTQTPDEVMTAPGDSGAAEVSTGRAPTGGGPGPIDDTGVATSAGTSDGVDDTTSNGVTTTPPPDPDTGNEGPMPQCEGPEDCGPNETCSGGSCVPACEPWAEGSYGGCLTEYGDFDVDGLCGEGHECSFWALPVEATACTRTGCRTACDCPGPLPTGTAVVSCGDVSGDEELECYLSCENGETCPDGMTCFGGACMTEPAPLPMYGNCGNVAADCEPGLQCVIEDGYSMCTTTCEMLSECDPDTPGGFETVGCFGVIFPPMGPECHLSCLADDECAEGMECFTAETGWSMCMWPPFDD